MEQRLQGTDENQMLKGKRSIFSNRIYNLANYYEKLGLMYLFRASVDQKNTSFSSKYSSAVKKAEKDLVRIVNRIEDIERPQRKYN